MASDVCIAPALFAALLRASIATKNEESTTPTAPFSSSWKRTSTVCWEHWLCISVPGIRHAENYSGLSRVGNNCSEHMLCNYFGPHQFQYVSSHSHEAALSHRSHGSRPNIPVRHHICKSCAMCLLHVCVCVCTLRLNALACTAWSATDQITMNAKDQLV